MRFARKERGTSTEYITARRERVGLSYVRAGETPLIRSTEE